MTHKAPQWARPTLRRIHSVLEEHPELGLEDDVARLAEWLEQQPAMKQRSEKRAEHMKNERIPAVQAAAPGGCRICPELERLGLSIGGRCPGVQGIHERRKSGSGGSRVNPDNLIPCCNRSNGFIEDQPELVRVMFGAMFVVREGDEEWSTLSKRNDRM
ncbi:MAG: hypothetical protein KA758_03510 [Acidimicrobiales bacterium]|nr:hypothetical protein [Acidimicrobiales bacterium]